jgi:hypothetical protein
MICCIFRVFRVEGLMSYSGGPERHGQTALINCLLFHRQLKKPLGLLGIMTKRESSPTTEGAP